MFNYTALDPQNVSFYRIAPLSDLPNGQRLFFEIEDKPIVIFNIAGQIFAIGDLCSHDDGPLGDGEIEDHNIVCPRHGAEFDLRSGQVKMMPAVQDIPAYPVRIVDNVIEVGIPSE